MRIPQMMGYIAHGVGALDPDNYITHSDEVEEIKCEVCGTTLNPDDNVYGELGCENCTEIVSSLGGEICSYCDSREPKTLYCGTHKMRGCSGCSDCIAVTDASIYYL